MDVHRISFCCTVKVSHQLKLDGGVVYQGGSPAIVDSIRLDGFTAAFPAMREQENEQ